jgi:Glycosyl hydrolase family 26
MDRWRQRSRSHLGWPAVAVLAALVLAGGAAAFVGRDDPPRAELRIGAYSPPAPEAGVGAIDSLAAAIGRPVDLVLWYQQWGGGNSAFEPAWIQAVTASGRTPLITWEPWAPGSAEQPEYRLRRIASGTFDSYIRSWATGLKALGTTVYLRPMHEMNGNWYPWAGTVNRNSPARYVAAWRHMWRIFDEVGAHNVRWVWSPLAEDVPATRANRFERYYPGSRYVDVLALDGYNWGSDYPQYGGWRSFATIFGRAFGRISKLGPQPIWIGETASAPEGGDKAQWIRDMLAWVSARPRIAALVWFNVVKERDWRATEPADAAGAFSTSATSSGAR